MNLFSPKDNLETNFIFFFKKIISAKKNNTEFSLITTSKIYETNDKHKNKDHLRAMNESVFYDKIELLNSSIFFLLVKNPIMKIKN